MKLSEAFVLGSTVIKPASGVLVDPDRREACALGMAGLAAGGTIGYGFAPLENKRTAGLDTMWPWLNNRVSRPCWCFLKPRKMRARDVIAHLFDEHVFGKCNWTMDRLAQFIRSIEPAETSQ